MNLSDIKGIGPKTLNILNKLSINTVNDLMRFYPYRYNIYKPSDITKCNDSDVIVVPAKIISEPKVSYIKRNFNRLSFMVEANNIPINVVIFNRAFYKPNLKINRYITLIGKYNKLKNQFMAADIKFKFMNSIEVEPVYHSASGISSSQIHKLITNVLSTMEFIDEIVPEYISEKYNLMNTSNSIREIHNPTNLNNLKQAKLKLKYEELFEFMFKINLIKYKNQIFDDFVIKDISDDTVKEIIDELPYELTSDQLNAINDIVKDFRNLKRMNRLILGDVGSGKTIVSFISILLNHSAGYQSALLAPTEVLACQHYDNFMSLFGNLGLKVELLVGSLKKSEKNSILERLKNGDIDLLIGTHAMLEDNVEFNNLGLVITDEQHRFGVNQRKSLQNKGMHVDVLYMSATPIPRTYALTIYGDMDISIIKEKPKGRKEIHTKVYNFKEINTVVEKIEQELLNGYQSYVVAPLIESEDGETNELNDLKKIEDTLKEKFKNKHSIGLLHGKMKQVEKDTVMNNFKEGKIEVLISTTVIEVGVDVKNATMMCIFNAERFGLATLHQLRGRVGRNSIESKCILISDKDTERLSVMESSNDGFYISEKDFEIRGSGDLFGVRQSGDMIFKIADLRTDYKILLQCKEDTEEFIKDNIENSFNNYSYYKQILDKLINTD
ncbi:MAG: ATP-dependent DNA helicase RecG [Bacilli bacterium]|nr:ATP-dependent DNA helicase RecG [Bacilli bacterium]